MWSPNMSWLCSENYYYGLPDDVRAMLDAQIAALPGGENDPGANNVIEQHWSATRRDAARGPKRAARDH